MKLLQTSTQTIAPNDLQMTRMGIDASSMDMIMGFLRDKIYSDKILAPIREYCCNALDAMVEANNTNDSVEIKLSPYNGYYVWSVRDRGMGLNDDDITNIFGCYGASRKRHTNEQVGSYGIGSGSAFAYTDSFYITSFHQGLKTSYVCTLGKGDNGVSVGEIYKISEEPTAEQGIEISFEVSLSDVSKFSATTRQFVSAYTPNAKLVFEDNYYNRMISPTLPTSSLQIGQYTISTYEHLHMSSPLHGYIIRMGGVCYPHTTELDTARPFLYTTVIDVPIGCLSIPISRESIETTPFNDKVFSEINNYLDDLYNTEVLSLTVPKFGSIITGQISLNDSCNGKWFRHGSDTFKTTALYKQCTTKYLHSHEVYRSANPVSTGPMHMVYLLPDIKNCNNWIKRIISALKTIQGDDYNGFVAMRKGSHEKLLVNLDNAIDISDCVFVDVKTLKLPKLVTAPIDRTTYIVYDRYSHKQIHSAESLDAEVRANHFQDAELDDDWYLHETELCKVKYRTIAISSAYGKRCGVYSTNSIKLYNALVELGWLEYKSSEFNKCLERLNVLRDDQRRKESIPGEMKALFLGSSGIQLVCDHLVNNPEKIENLRSVMKRIKAENTTRGRILRNMTYYSYTDNSLTRQDLRQILRLRE